MAAKNNKHASPNIIFIMSDQHNADVMGCAGDRYVRTPNLDRLAAAGCKLTEMHTSCPLCVPARMGFMTAKWPSQINVWNNGDVLYQLEPTFAHYFGAENYETILSGKMHFQGIDQFHGFEKRPVAEAYGRELFPSGAKWSGNNYAAFEHVGGGDQGYEYYDKLATDTACDIINRHSTDNRPLCMVVGLVSPHNPYVCRKELFDYYYNLLPANDCDVSEDRIPADLRQRRISNGLDKVTPEQARRARAAYYGLVTQVDENVGQITAALEQRGMLDDAIVIYSSDHGDMLGRHGLWNKVTFMNGSVKIPAIISWPGRIRAGTTLSTVCNIIDWAPTMMDLALNKKMPDIAGRSLKSLLLGEQSLSSWENMTFAEGYHENADTLDSPSIMAPSFMIRKDEWKFIYFHATGKYQLYNQQNDPDELSDVAHLPENCYIVDEFMKIMKDNWSGDHVAQTIAKYKRAKALFKKLNYPVTPHELPEIKAPEQYRRFNIY